MKTLKEPKYRDLQLSECAGAPILRTLWERMFGKKRIERLQQDETKQRYVRIAAIVAMRLKEDQASSNVEQLDDESSATYKGAYLIIRTHHDPPKGSLTDVRETLAN